MKRKLERRMWCIACIAVTICLLMLNPGGDCAEKMIAMPKRHPLDSTSLASAGYNPELHLFEVEFRTGEVYRYAEVPGAVYREFLAAESKGRFFSKNIRGQFAFSHVAKAKK